MIRSGWMGYEFVSRFGFNPKPLNGNGRVTGIAKAKREARKRKNSAKK